MIRDFQVGDYVMATVGRDGHQYFATITRIDGIKCWGLFLPASSETWSAMEFLTLITPAWDHDLQDIE